MMKKRAFISFDFDNDENLKNLLAGQAKLPDSPFYFQDWSVKEPFPQSSWKSDVKTKIRGCHFVLVLIGPRTHKCSGVLEEIRIAKEENIPCFGIFQAGNNYYVPNGVTSWYEWKWPVLERVIASI